MWGIVCVLLRPIVLQRSNVLCSYVSFCLCLRVVTRERAWCLNRSLHGTHTHTHTLCAGGCLLHWLNVYVLCSHASFSLFVLFFTPSLQTSVLSSLLFFFFFCAALSFVMSCENQSPFSLLVAFLWLSCIFIFFFFFCTKVWVIRFPEARFYDFSQCSDCKT